MDALWTVDWQALFVPSGSLLELVLRGSLMYLFMLLLLRLLRREAGQVGIADILVLVVIADAASNGMAGEYQSITEGAVLVATILAWDFLLDWASFRSPRLRRVLQPPPLALVVNGQLQRSALRREMISNAELMGLLREQGVEKLAQVKRCYMESNGNLSVITHGARN